MSKTIKITEDKFKRVLREVFKEEIYEDNQRPFEDQAKEKKLEMGVGNDGTLEHNVGIEFEDETRDANFYPGLNDKPI
jgi:rubrerythrin